MTSQERAELMHRVQQANIGEIPPMPEGVQERIDNSLGTRCQDEVKALRVKRINALGDGTQIVLA